jgi:O-antigen/teichoic acid export membrane protein
LAGFAATFLIALYLGPEGLGLYAVAVSIGFYWMVIPANAVASAIRKRTSERGDSAGYLGGGLILSGIIAAVGAAVVLIAGEVLGGIVSRNREIMRVLITYNVEIAALFVAAVAYRAAVGTLDGQKRVAETGG